MNVQEELTAACALVEAQLNECFRGEGLEAAMRYSLLAGGKRIRPVLTMKFCQLAGGAMEDGLEFGCGVEMLHTYSLIHDDLPCMDNDDLRRGKPTNHKQFGECTATLAGDALQAAAFQMVLSAGKPQDSRSKVLAAGILAQAAGYQGMCGGQYWDTIGDGQPHTLDELTAINDKKTGALLRAACMMGIAAAGCGEDDPRMKASREYAANLGLAFQIRDDILDKTASQSALGKTLNSDAANQKSTYASLLGVEACEALVLDYTARAKEALNTCVWKGSVAFLCELADSLARRSY